MKLEARPCVITLMSGCILILVHQPLPAQLRSPVSARNPNSYAAPSAAGGSAQPTGDSWQFRQNRNAVQTPALPVGKSRSQVVLASSERTAGVPHDQSPPIVASSNDALRQQTRAPAIAETADRIALTRTEQSDAEATGVRSKSVFQTILSVASSLLIVVGLFLGVAWCYRKSLANSLSTTLPKSVVTVLGRTPIAARQQVMLLRFGSKLVLVSMAQGEARTISEITDPLEVDRLAGLCESGQPTSITQSFRSVLAKEDAR